jgi:hypothetical protein
LGGEFLTLNQNNMKSFTIIMLAAWLVCTIVSLAVSVNYLKAGTPLYSYAISSGVFIFSILNLIHGIFALREYDKD